MGIIAKVTSFTFVIVFLITGSLIAQAPGTIVYQGRLTDVAGNPITSPQTVIFSIYSVPTGGLVRWDETLTIQPDAEGVFIVELGTIDTTLASVFSGGKRYLGIKIGMDDEMSPRQLLTSTPYAMHAQSIPDESVTTNRLADSSVTTVKLVEGAVTSYSVKDNSLTDVDILDEPGIAFTMLQPPNTFLLIPAGTNALDSIKITAPAPGYVYVWAQAEIAVDHKAGTVDQLIFQVTPNQDTIIPNNYGFAMIMLPAEMPTQSPTSSYIYPVDAHRTFQVSAAGEYTFYFNAKVSSGGGNSDAFFNLQMTAMYFPTAYGPVNLSPPPPSNGEQVLQPNREVSD